MNALEFVKVMYCFCYPTVMCVLTCVYLKEDKNLQIIMQVLVIVTYYIYFCILRTLI